MTAYDLGRVVERIRACAQDVAKRLPAGRALDSYETALDLDMRENKLQFARQYPIGVPFDGPPDRGFYADFIVEGRVLLELIHVPTLRAEDGDLALNYLRESGADICLLINFGRSPAEIRRILPSGESNVESG